MPNYPISILFKVVAKEPHPKYIGEEPGEAYLLKVKNQTELRKIKKEISNLKKKLKDLEAQKADLEDSLRK